MSLLAVTERGSKAGRPYRGRLLCTDAFTISDTNRQHQYVTPDSSASSISSRMLFGQCIMVKEILA